MSDIDEDIRVRRVNRYDDWSAQAMFGGYEFRIVLKPEPSYIESLNRAEKLRIRLNQEAGTEGEDWILILGKDEDEFYLRNSMFLLSWKMKNPEDYKKWLHKVEHHTVDDGKLEQQVLDDEEAEKEAEVRRERELEEKIKQAKLAQQNQQTQLGNMFGGGFGPGPVHSPKPKTYTNSDNPADWEFAWVLSNHEDFFKYEFYIRKINSPNEIEIDYDMTAHLTEDDSAHVTIYGTNDDRDVVRKYLLSLGFTENPKILKEMFEWDCYTDQMINNYHDVISGKTSIDSIIGLGWEVWYHGEEEGHIFFMQPINGDNDQFYPFELGDDWHTEIMECHSSYEGDDKNKAIKQLKAMGFLYSGEDIQ